MFFQYAGMPLMKRFYQDRYLHIRSFAFQLTISLAVCAVLYNLRDASFYSFDFKLWHLLLIPFGIYVGGVSAVFIHNATHGSFPNRWLNEVSGYLAGVHQLWGFMGWKLIHLVHHHYSDNEELDPHAPNGRSFWQFAKVMFLISSHQITKRYQEHWGMGIKTKILHKGVLILFSALVAANLALWFMLLGPIGFVFFYIPSYIANHLLFVDINYTAHPRDPVTGKTAAANLDNTLYYKLANLCWFGIYYHSNHHRKPLLFNPKYMPASRRQEQEAEQESGNIAA